MNAPTITLESVHSEVVARPQGPTAVAVAVHVNFDKPVREGNTVTVRFRLVKDTTLVRTTVTGVLVITSQDEKELRELLDSLGNQKKPPLGLVEYVLLRTQPLILLIEDYMGLPPIPVPPPPRQGEVKEVRTGGVNLYQ